MWRALLALFLSLTCPAFLAEAQAEENLRVSLTWENDLFGGTDRHYTNGVKLTLFGANPSVLGATTWGLTVGQELYTPEEVDQRQVVGEDRPYAAWAYVELSLRWIDEETEDTLSLAVGVVGPTAQGEATHSLFHRATGSTKPRGWRNQLEDEVGVVLRYQRAFKLVSGGGTWEYEVSPLLGASLGNIDTRGSLGGRVRVGWGLPGRGEDRLAFYVEAKAEVSFVAYNVFLDGNLTRAGGHRVDKRAVVGTASLGFTIALSRSLSLSYTHTITTEEFVRQRSSNQFGALSVAFAW